MTSADDSDLFRTAKDLFLRALALAPPERASFLATVEAPAEVVATARELLAAHDDGQSSRVPDPDGHPRHVGPFTILRLLGRGGMGTVYLAHRGDAATPVALKVLHPGVVLKELRQRFDRECEVLRRLDHPGIARLVEAGSLEPPTGPMAYLAMQYVDGEDLMSFVRRTDPPPAARLALLADVADAVAHAHERGVVHRDLKPDNILVDRDGHPHVLDFGVARLLDADLRTVSLATGAGQLVGTLRYMSPEQAGGEPGSIASDIHALGLLTHEALTGSLPYEVPAEPLHQAVLAIATAEPAPPSASDPRWRGPVDAVVGKALAREPDERYADAALLAADLRACVDGGTVTARSPHPWRRLRRLLGRRRSALARSLVLAGLLAALLALVIVGSRRDGEATAQQRAALYTSLEYADQRLHFEQHTTAGVRAALDTLNAVRTVLAASSLPEASSLRRYTCWRQGEANYFLGEMEHAAERHENAYRCFGAASMEPLDLVSLAALDPVSTVTPRIRELSSHQPASGKALARAALAEFSSPRRNLADSHNAIREAHGLCLRNGDDGYWPEVEQRIRRRDLAILHNDEGRYLTLWSDVTDSLELVESALASFAVADTIAALRHDWSAYGSFLHGYGMAYRIHHRLTDTPADLDSALARLDRALAIRGPNRMPGSHARTRCEIARVIRARTGGDRTTDLRLALADLDFARAGLDPDRHRMTLGRLLLLQAEIQLDLAEVQRRLDSFDRADSLLAAAADHLPSARFPRDGAERALVEARSRRLRYGLAPDPALPVDALHRLDQGAGLLSADQHPRLAREYVVERQRLNELIR